jgi:hypothetical protein
MPDPLIFWYGIWAVLLAGFLIILKMDRNRRAYFLYFFFGMAFGFYFDSVSFAMGYYSYPDIFPLVLFGLPVSMTIAEGFAVAITIWLYGFFKGLLKKRWTGLTSL